MSGSEVVKTPLPSPATVASEKNDAACVVAGGAAGTASSNTAFSTTAAANGVPTSTGALLPGSTAANSATTVITIKGKTPPKPPDEFYKDLHVFHERRGTPITQPPRITGCLIDLHRLYSEVTERGGFLKVNMRDDWDEVLPALGINERCVNGSAAMKHIYRRYLEKYERLNYFGEDPDKIEALEACEALELGGRSRGRYPSLMHGAGGGGSLNVVPMSYNYRQHIVNMDRRRMYKLSTELHRPSPYEKLVLSLLSPLPNEQDFAINVCTLMANENKHTLRLNDHPKLLDVLLSHAGVFPDHTMRKLFNHVYTKVRRHSLLAFWLDLLHDKPPILELYKEEPLLRQADTITATSETMSASASEEYEDDDDIEVIKRHAQLVDEFSGWDFLSLGRAEGTQDYVGQRVQQVVSILRNLTFFEENLPVLSKNRTFLRFVVMSANVRWGNVHISALDMVGNVATDLLLNDPSIDDLSRSLLATLCDGIEGSDRAVIISCLEILYKLCQNEANEDYITKCLTLPLYETLCLFLSLNDIMLLIFSLEAIYALTTMGSRSCHLLMQVRGVVDQLVSLITVEAQSYGPDGCILMRVVETVPGNMLPMVAQNIANLQNVAVLQKQHQHSATAALPTAAGPLPPANAVALPAATHHALPPLPAAPHQPHSVPAAELQQQQKQLVLQQPVLQVQMVTPSGTPHPTGPVQVLSKTNLQSPAISQSAAQLLPPAMPAAPQEAQQKVPQTPAISAPSSPAPAQQLQMTPITVTPVAAAPPPIITAATLAATAHDDEQYALAWLGATFERTGTNECRVEQLELYRMYLVHCQKSGRHTVVTQAQFPRLVRVIFSSNVGPMSVRRHDGTDIPGLHYVAIRMRAQPLVIQCVKTPAKAPGGTSVGDLKAKAELLAMRKMKKLLSEGGDSAAAVGGGQQLQSQPQPMQLPKHSGGASSSGVKVLEVVQVVPPHSQSAAAAALIGSNIAAEIKPLKLDEHGTAQPSSSALIKSLLANKVNQRQQKQKELTAGGGGQTASSSTGNAGVSTPAIKATSNTISALVNNPLMQHTPVKVGQTTIKPLNPQVAYEKKQLMDSAPPPLAPLSGGNMSGKDHSGRPVIIANQMLVEMLDKKGGDPPMAGSGGGGSLSKRKMEEMGGGEPQMKRGKEEPQPVTPSKNAANLYAEMAASILEDEDLDDIPPLPQPSQSFQQQQPMQQMLEQQPTPPPSQSPAPMVMTTKMQQPTTANVQSGGSGMQRQLLFQQPQQLKQMPTAMATIKTDQGLQTVPVILQQKPAPDGGGNQSQQLLQQVMQHGGVSAQPQQQTTQYVLATNQQGQTYLVAQQTTQPQVVQQQQPPPPPTPPPTTQTVLVTQTPQQQTTGAKTIIILQQQTLPGHSQPQLIAGGGGSMPKMIMTTAQGQQVLVTQRPQAGMTLMQHPHHHHQQQPQQQYFISSPALLAAATGQQQQQQTTMLTHTQSPQPGQMSPSLLNQLNHIPATIKLHQPQPQQQLGGGVIMQSSPQPATISRLGKTMSIVQAAGSTTAAGGGTAIQIPQLQQHQSIIQQHIISGPVADKRAVVLSGGRAVEIKETLIAPAPAAGGGAASSSQLQSNQLNAQTIITKAAPVQRVAAIEQQHSAGAIIQQKVTLAGGTLSKESPPPGLVPAMSSLSQAKPAPPISQSQSVVQTIVTAATPAQAILTGKKLPLAVTSAIAGGGGLHIKPVQTAQTAGGGGGNAAAKNGGPPPLVSTTTAGVGGANVSASTFSCAQQRPGGEKGAQSGDKTPGTPPSTPAMAGTPPLPTTTTTATPLVDANWLYVCDWRNCPRRKFKSLNDLQHHACTAHCPDHLDAGAEIFCQWGPGPGLCDGVPRKRYSLMTHLMDRHITAEGLRIALQRRLATGAHAAPPSQPPVTIVRNVDRGNTASPALSTSSSGSLTGSSGSSAFQAIKRHTAEFVNPKELMDENEGPVTKSIRLTAALILRNLVTYTGAAKRSLRRYEPHLANVALSNVESSGAISHILYELNN